MNGIKEKWSSWFGKYLRNSRVFTDLFPIAILQSVILTFTGSFLSMFLFNLDIFKKLFLLASGGDDRISEFFANYMVFLGIWIIFFIIAIVFKKNHPMLRMIIPQKKTIKHILVGILLGFGSNSFCILMVALVGDIKLSFNAFELLPFFVFVIAVFIQSGAEEIIDRLYLYSKLRRRYKNPLVAVLVNSLVFAYMHKGNDGFTLIAGIQIFLVALVFSEFVYWYDGLWIAMTFHASWNFCQSIFFGLPNSGIVSAYSVFKLDLNSARNGFFYNVNFGLEGSIGACIVLLIIAVVLFFINRNKKEKLDIWAPYDVEQALLDNTAEQ